MTACPRCPVTAPHSAHLFSEPESPLALAVTRGGATLWLPGNKPIYRKQPDAVRALRADLRHWREGAVGR